MQPQLAILGGPKLRSIPFPEEEPSIGQCEIDDVTAALQDKRLSIFSSDRVREFEQAFSSYIGTQHAISVTSCTAALHTALLAIDTGPGDEVILPVYTHMSTANAVMLTGAEPVFVDIDQSTYNIEVSQIESAVTARTKAIIAVDLFGQPASRDALMRLQALHSIRLIEDCAQSTGARYQGKPVGGFDIGCHSFGEIKNISTAEGGMITTNDAEVARKARLIRHEGEAWQATQTSVIDGHPQGFLELIYGIGYPLIGHNYRMNALQAALGLCQLAKLDSLNGRRSETAQYYIQELNTYRCLKLPLPHDQTTPVYNRFVMRVDEEVLGLSRDAFLGALIAEGIPAGVYYPVPLNQHAIMQTRGYRCAQKEYPAAEAACKDQIVLPSYPALAANDRCDVVMAVRKIIDIIGTNPNLASQIENTVKSLQAHYFGQFFTV